MTGTTESWFLFQSPLCELAHLYKSAPNFPPFCTSRLSLYFSKTRHCHNLLLLRCQCFRLFRSFTLSSRPKVVASGAPRCARAARRPRPDHSSAPSRAAWGGAAALRLLEFAEPEQPAAGGSTAAFPLTGGYSEGVTLGISTKPAVHTLLNQSSRSRPPRPRSAPAPLLPDHTLSVCNFR